MKALRARAVIGPDGTVTLKAGAGTEPGEREVMLPVSGSPEVSDPEAILALAGAWCDWSDDEFEEFLDELAMRRHRTGGRDRGADAA
ncbi:MAG: hypothetical protein K8E66_08225 [Phycisphaerales bacterium]|nr:hypothetical protein [Phycisphaerales bacterium]